MTNICNENDVQIMVQKKQVRALEAEKRFLSKQVANAKAECKPVDLLVSKVKEISLQIKTEKASLKLLNTSISDHEPNIPETGIFPPQFAIKAFSSSKRSFSVAELSENEGESWDEYVFNHPNACIYHTLSTREVVKASFNHPTLYLVAKGQDKRVCGVLPLIQQKSRLFGDSWSSVPFFNYGGVLADNHEIEKALLVEAKKHVGALGSSRIEYRNCHPSGAMPCRDDKISMLRTLPLTPNQLWKGLGSKLRAQIKKAQSKKLAVRTGRLELVEDFYDVFSVNMRDLGTPVYSKKLFINMLNQHESANITAIYLDNKPIAVGFTLGWRNTLEIPWASTLRSANYLNANMLLYWEILQFAIGQKYQIFDFGRSSKDASTYKFKKQWGAEPHQLYWHYQLFSDSELPKLNPDNPKFKLLIATWKKLPVWLANLIGPYVVKYLP